jgi:hypothetical protein
MTKRTFLLIGAALAAAAPAAAGTGWSRADDLSVYAAMRLYGGIAREQQALCGGFAPASVMRHWDERYGAREAAVGDALAGRYGEAPVRRAARPRALRQPCRPLPDDYWRRRYERLLGQLEARLDPAWRDLAPRPIGPRPAR